MIALGSDHGGFDLKQRVKAYLDEKHIPYKDYGCDSKESCDYPIFAKAAAEAVASGECEKGIVICTTGIGISIAANKVKGIRCALCGDPLSASLTRRHNNANMLAMGAGMMPIALSLGGADMSFRSPMAVAVIGGLITSTVLSLLVVPAVFTWIDDFEHWFVGLFRRPRGGHAAAPEAAPATTTP